jgi:hypothetical protein
MTLLLQSPIRCCGKPAAGGLAPQTFDVLHEYALYLGIVVYEPDGT